MIYFLYKVLLFCFLKFFYYLLFNNYSILFILLSCQIYISLVAYDTIS
jgi:hypothetical protein